MIPKNIIICNNDDDISIFKNKKLYRTNNKITYISNSRLFSPLTPNGLTLQ
jgi:hypothetical protein